MKIQSINKQYFINTNFKAKKQAPNLQEKPQAKQKSRLARFSYAIGEIFSYTQQENRYFENFLHKKGKVTKEEYEEIAKYHPRALTKCYELCDTQFPNIKTKPQDIARISIALKESYDNLYGENNYTIVSIGTSPALITEVMQNIGCSVIFLPVSGLRDYSENSLHPLRTIYPTITSRHPNLKILMHYAYKKGILNKNIKNLIVLDYKDKGTSLTAIMNLLKENYLIDSSKLKEHSLLTDLNEILTSNSKGNITEADIKKLKNDLEKNRLSAICNVPHFYYNAEDTKDTHTVSSKGKTAYRVYREFDEFSKPNGRIWSLIATDEAMKILNKKNPA